VTARGGATDWDADAYHRVSGMQEMWGRKVLDRLRLEGNETVLDAGCGSGRMTRHILERVPRGRVIGVDASPAMIERARHELEGAGEVELIVADLLELELPEPVDAIFSNAAFHWVKDHERLFRRLHGALRPGGAIEAQFGAQGNVAEWEAAILALEGDERFAPYLRGMPQPWYFASLGDTEARLNRAGFEIARLWIETFDEQPPEPLAFMRASGLNAHLERLPEELRDEFVGALADSLPRPLTLHYVRLNVSARRPA
jgi:trans-aconitate 2-methyltransferase